MAIRAAQFWAWAAALFCIFLECQAEVSYDGTSLIINGQRKLILSGSIHYPRSTPEMWDGLMDSAKAGGLDCIDTYVFWNLHEPQRGQFNFEGRLDLVRFLKTIQSRGLYATLRIGPFIEAEWNFGGLPYWLAEVPGIVFRTNNEPFKKEMQRFVTMIVQMLKEHNLFASQGGPIIISQIENEYGNVESSFKEGGQLYVKWAAEMAVGLQTGVPWVMCKQPDAPDPVINTCNGMYCGDTFTFHYSDKKPKMWTEDWTAWFQLHGGSKPHRPVEDIAYAVARFFAKKGTYMNYYMYHGGTNFGRTAGPFITTSYDYDAPIDEYGIINQPKWGHLKNLNMIIRLCSNSLLYGALEMLSLGPAQEAHVYNSEAGSCAAFLSNMDNHSDVKVTFQGNTYVLPAWSVSILPDCKNAEFNTAKVTVRPASSVDATYLNFGLGNSFMGYSTNENWEEFQEPFGAVRFPHFRKQGLLEHIRVTKDASDYLWYTVSFEVDKSVAFLQRNELPVLVIDSYGHAVHVFVNNKYEGFRNGNKASPGFVYELPVSLVAGVNTISLLSVMVGLQNSGAHYENRPTGLKSVMLKGLQPENLDLSRKIWTYQIGLAGEILNIFSPAGLNRVNWTSFLRKEPLTWYKSTISVANCNGPFALNLSSMGKGQAWVNGNNIGRYWVSAIVPSDECRPCNYRGLYYLKKCATNCGQPSQTLYHVPRSWLRPGDNLLVISEEIGGDPTKISLVSGGCGNTICSYATEHYTVSNHSDGIVQFNYNENSEQTVKLNCSEGKSISSIDFASFGNPEGQCGRYIKGTCHSTISEETVRKACLGRRGCSLTVSSTVFGDPCNGMAKSFVVQATCR